MKHLVKTFFNGSSEKVVEALLDISNEKLSEEDYQRLSQIIENARKEER